jgi:uncharacterized repeat protein (TIGR01451 family)
MQLLRALCFFPVLALFAPAVWAQTPAGTQISSFAQASYEAPNGLTFVAYSDTLVMVVAQVAGTDLEPPRSAVSDPAKTVVFNHTLTNMGNGTDSMTLVATSRMGWPVRMHLDANADGILDAGDPQVSGPITLAMGDVAPLLIAIDVPGLATVRGTFDTISVVATSLTDPTISDGLIDVLEIRDVGIVVSLNKLVDRTSATIGDILTYTISYNASGTNTATNFEIKDLIPTGTSYVPGTLRWNGTSLTDIAGDDAGVFDVGGNRVVFRIGTIQGGDSGTVTFQVRVG